jgi:cytochrome c oxidase assembly protein subunit 15
MSVFRAPSAARFAWGVLAFNVAVILWGAYVRASGSGAGCGDHWPLCNGQVLPRAPQVATMIEFAHRVTSGLALALVAGLLTWTWRVTRKRSPARRAAVAAFILILNEAWLGALLVLLQRVGHDTSAGRAVLLSLHFANTLLLLASLALCARWLSAAPAPPAASAAGRGRLIAVAAGLGVIVLVGASGAIAALGDTLFPATSLRSALNADLSPVSHFLLRLRVIHPILAVTTLLFVLWLSVASSRRQPQHATGRSGRDAAPAFTSGTAVIILYFLQLMLGMLNVALLAPVWLQITHLLVANLFWIAAVLASDDLLPAQTSASVASAVA